MFPSYNRNHNRQEKLKNKVNVPVNNNKENLKVLVYPTNLKRIEIYLYIQ